MSRQADQQSSPLDGSPGEVTQLLQKVQAGDREALSRLFDIVYQQIRLIARRRMAGSGDGLTINTTGLIHESYIRMVDSSRLRFNDSGHFFATASRVMRNIVVDSARSHHAAKRGGGQRPLTLDTHQIAVEDQAEQLCEIDRQLSRLEAHDQRLTRLIELRFFGGLSEPETAEALGVSLATVQRDWARARAWFQLHCAVRGGAGEPAQH